MLKQIGPTAMQLSVVEFDEDEAKGWRALQNQECFAEAAQLIEYFALEYDSNYRRLKWHLAQMQAFAGNTTEALAAARLSTSPVQEQMHPDFDWNDYVLATIAFLQKDRAAFDLHRSSLKGNRTAAQTRCMRLESPASPPTLSRKREREREQARSGSGSGSLSRVLVGEGWGEGGSILQGLRQGFCQSGRFLLRATPRSLRLCVGELMCLN